MTLRSYVLTLVSFVVTAWFTAAWASSYQCIQVVQRPGVVTAYASAQCATTIVCHPFNGCFSFVQMENTSAVGSMPSTAYLVPTDPYPQSWQQLLMSMSDGTSIGLIGLFDGPFALVDNQWVATGDFYVRDELFASDFDTGP